MLSVQGLTVQYGGNTAVRSASFDVATKTCVAVVGRNGAGKSSLLRAIIGLVSSRSERLTLAGINLAQMATYRRVRLGVTLVPEGRQVIPALSVEANLAIGASSVSRRVRRQRMEDIVDRFPLLRSRMHQVAGSLSGGEQQLLAIGRALMSQPKLLLMDEPSMGLAPMLVDEVFGVIQSLKRNGITLLIVEQNVRKVMEVADRLLVMQTGVLTAETGNKEVDLDSLQAAYLGRGDAQPAQVRKGV